MSKVEIETLIVAKELDYEAQQRKLVAQQEAEQRKLKTNPSQGL